MPDLKEVAKRIERESISRGQEHSYDEGAMQANVQVARKLFTDAGLDYDECFEVAQAKMNAALRQPVSAEHLPTLIGTMWMDAALVVGTYLKEAR